MRTNEPTFVKWVVLVVMSGDRHIVGTKSEAITVAKKLGRHCEIFPLTFQRKGDYLVEVGGSE